LHIRHILFYLFNPYANLRFDILLQNAVSSLRRVPAPQQRITTLISAFMANPLNSEIEAADEKLRNLWLTTPAEP
jgi:hypothetical protein